MSLTFLPCARPDQRRLCVLLSVSIPRVIQLLREDTTYTFITQLPIRVSNYFTLASAPQRSCIDSWAMSPQAPSYTGVTPLPAPSDGDLFDISLPSHQIIIATETLCIGLTTLVVTARTYTKCAVLRRWDYDDCE